jgi:ring-1,2-phenylacetyl-CoA epoxidase subunit PaaC
MTAPTTQPSTPMTQHPSLITLLTTLADDELILGWSDSEWTGIAPILEEDVAMSSISQDEIGHAQAFYQLLSEITGTAPDDYAFGRALDEYRCAWLIGHNRADWAFTIARRYLYETADAVRLAALAGSSYRPLADLVAKMRREEQYHLLHFQTWFERFLGNEVEGRARFVAALQDAWPAALDIFATLDGEDELVREGILPEPMSVLRERWESMLRPIFERNNIELPNAEPPAQPRRGGTHPDFAWLHNEMTTVYRMEPGAEW